MVREAALHLAVVSALALAYVVTPGHAAPWALLFVFLTWAAAVGLLVSRTTTQLFVPTVFQGPTSAKAVAFTFDDGPDPTYTSLVLDALRAHDAKATFFVVGLAAEAHPELVRRIVADGHLVASHTYSHSHAFHFWRSRRMAADIERGIDAVERITGQRPRYFRPPQGLRVPILQDALGKLSPPPACVTWTVRGIDSVARSAEAIVARVTKGLAPGSIITLHDGTAFGGVRSRAPMIDALHELLSAARARQLRCVRLDELLAPKEPS